MTGTWWKAPLTPNVAALRKLCSHFFFLYSWRFLQSFFVMPGVQRVWPLMTCSTRPITLRHTVNHTCQQRPQPMDAVSRLTTNQNRYVDPFPQYAQRTPSTFSGYALSLFFIPHLNQTPVPSTRDIIQLPVISSCVSFFFVLWLFPHCDSRYHCRSSAKIFAFGVHGCPFGLRAFRCISLGSGVSARWASPRGCSILPMNFTHIF